MAKFIHEKQLEIVATEIQDFIKELIVREPEFKNDPA